MDTGIQNSEIASLAQWAGQVASLYLATGERSGALAEMLRQNYTHEGIKACADALIARTGAETSGDARIKGFSTSVVRAVPRVLDADGKPTKIPAVLPLAVSFKLRKAVERASGTIRKTLTAQVLEKEKSEKDLAKECANASVAALMSAWAAGADDDTISALRMAVESVILALKCGRIPHDYSMDQLAALVAKLDNALANTSLDSGDAE